MGGAEKPSLISRRAFDGELPSSSPCVIEQLLWLLNHFPEGFDFSRHARCALGKSFDGVGASVTTLEFFQDRAQRASTEMDLSNDGRQIESEIGIVGAR